MRRQSRQLLLFSVVLCLTAGCGTKGPLYLPKPPVPAAKPPAAQPSEQPAAASATTAEPSPPASPDDSTRHP